MKWYWWVGIIGGVWYLSKKPSSVNIAGAQKSGLVKAVSDKVAPFGVTNVEMFTNKDGSLTFTGMKWSEGGKPWTMPSGQVISGKPSIPQKVLIGTFPSPKEVNSWVVTWKVAPSPDFKFDPGFKVIS